MEAKSVNQDMGSASVPKLMLNLAIPAVIAQLINMLYNIVDRIYIGHIPQAHQYQHNRIVGYAIRRIFRMADTHVQFFCLFQVNMVKSYRPSRDIDKFSDFRL